MQPIVARRRLFSTAHLYKQDAFSDEKNREIFGACYSAHGHGHNYYLEIFVEGPVSSENGLVVNVNELDAIMKTVCEPFDHLHISFDVPAFKGIVPTTEHLASYFYKHVCDELARSLPKLKLNRIRLYETDDLWVTAKEASAPQPPAKESNVFELTHEITVRAMHHLQCASWTPEQNKDFYGICYGQHGHDYRVRVTVKGSMNETTGLSFSRDELEQVLNSEIREKYDGVDLNKRFKNTSCEQLTIEFHDLLLAKLPPGKLVRVGIQETRKNYFEFPAAGTFGS